MDEFEFLCKLYFKAQEFPEIFVNYVMQMHRNELSDSGVLESFENEILSPLLSKSFLEDLASLDSTYQRPLNKEDLRSLKEFVGLSDRRSEIGTKVAKPNEEIISNVEKEKASDNDLRPEINLEFTSASGKKWVPNSMQAGKKALGNHRVGSAVDKAAIAPEEKCAYGKEANLPKVKGCDEKLIELIMNEVLDKSPNIDWEDVSGLEYAKSTLREIIIWPMLRPDIFTGLRGPPKGILLFGPPGTGKTLIGKCIASKANATFFSISASSLTSKWVGEGEKMVRTMFMVAKHYQPAVVFIDEIDSLLSQRCDGEHESSRRIKTEFLVQLDGCSCLEHERILVVGATNRPQELDEAARRRFVKRLYIPLPERNARLDIISRLLKDQKHDISHEALEVIVNKSEGFSGADVANLCKEAAMGPLRCLKDITSIKADDVPPIKIDDFISALQHVKASVSPLDLKIYKEWNALYGMLQISENTS